MQNPIKSPFSNLRGTLLHFLSLVILGFGETLIKFSLSIQWDWAIKFYFAILLKLRPHGQNLQILKAWTARRLLSRQRKDKKYYSPQRVQGSLSQALGELSDFVMAELYFNQNNFTLAEVYYTKHFAKSQKSQDYP